MSLLFPLIGAHLPYPVGPCLDPVGALLLSLFIIYDWGHTCLATILALTGIEASERTWSRALYLAYRFSVVEAVNGFKSIRSYRAGDGAWVEVDMMMNEDEKVRTAHDVAETLQYCLEGLGEVDRAFVTVDCEYPLSALAEATGFAHRSTQIWSKALPATRWRAPSSMDSLAVPRERRPSVPRSALNKLLISPRCAMTQMLTRIFVLVTWGGTPSSRCAGATRPSLTL